MVSNRHKERGMCRLKNAVSGAFKLIILQMLMVAVIPVGYIFNIAPFVTYITIPIFVMCHFYFLTGIINMRDEGKNVKGLQIFRFVIFPVYILIAIFGIFSL